MPDALYIQAGDLRHTVTIKAPSTSRDATGETVPDWNTVLTTRASIEGTNSRTFKESFGGNALASQSTDLLTIRWPGPTVDIEPGMRVMYRDNVFLIQAVDNVKRQNRKVVLACIAIDEDSN